MKKTMTALLSGAIAFGSAAAGDGGDTELHVAPTGRILLDAAAYSPRGGLFTDGVAIPDIRLGVDGSYGRWSARIDACLAYGRVSMRDVYIEYQPSGTHRFTGGYITPEFGLNTPVQSCMKSSMEEMTSDVFTNATGRNIALMYTCSAPKVWTAVSGFTDAASLTTPANDQGKTSFGAANRTFLRHLTPGGAVMQAGVSASCQTALHERVTGPDGGSYTTPGYFDFAADFPSRVCSVGMLEARVGDARSVFRLSPELLLMKGRVALESQYYYMRVSRTGALPAYRAKGAYALLRCMLLGEGYSYDASEGCIDLPEPRSLELTAGFDITDANCHAAGIMGGLSRDLSLTLTCWLNSFMLARLRYSWTDVRGRADMPDTRVSIIQARFQINF